ncbi:MAG: response regulator, partial [Pseudomonadota bacterium]
KDGREAVAQYKALRPHLVFMDISMPEVDGKEATGQIRAYEAEHELPRVPIVAMTAHALSGDKEEIIAAGLDHYLTKPLKRALLLNHIDKACPEGCFPALDAAEASAG